MSQGPCAVAALAAVVAAAETGTAIAAAIRHTASSRVRRRILVIRDTKPSVFISFLVSGQGCPGGSSEVRRPRRRGVVQATTILRVYSRTEKGQLQTHRGTERFDRRWVTSAKCCNRLIRV